jgi:hypothetical protein
MNHYYNNSLDYMDLMCGTQRELKSFTSDHLYERIIHLESGQIWLVVPKRVIPLLGDPFHCMICSLIEHIDSRYLVL